MELQTIKLSYAGSCNGEDFNTVWKLLFMQQKLDFRWVYVYAYVV